MKKILKFIAEEVIGITGLVLVRKSDPRNRAVMPRSLEFLSKTTNISTIIDIGASDGRWSLEAKKYFNRSKFHLIEGNKSHEEALMKNLTKLNDASYTLKVAGSKLGDIYFDDKDLFGGIASNQPNANYSKMEATTIDHEVSSKQLIGPFLIKFDTHGFEKQILIGAKETLKNTNAILMECYNFKISENALLFWEMCAFLEENGFRTADIVNQLHRPSDDFLWQIDILFLRSDRPAFNRNTYLP